MPIAVYVANAVRECTAFVDNFNNALQRVESTEFAVLLREFKPYIGADGETRKGAIGRHGDSALNENGRHLLLLCCNNGLCIMNTFFQHREVHKYRWYKFSKAQKSFIDFCIVSSDLFSKVLEV